MLRISKALDDGEHMYPCERRRLCNIVSEIQRALADTSTRTLFWHNGMVAEAEWARGIPASIEAAKFAAGVSQAMLNTALKNIEVLLRI